MRHHLVAVMLNHQQSVATGELALSVLVCRVLVPLSGTMRQMAAGRDRGAGRRPRSRARAISPRPLHDVSIVLAAPAAVSQREPEYCFASRVRRRGED